MHRLARLVVTKPHGSILPARSASCAFSVSSLRSAQSNYFRTPQDPYPNLHVRHAPQTNDAVYSESAYPNPAPIERHNEPIENKRARLLYQSRKRGILETDLLLSTFAQKFLGDMSEKELIEYDRLLDEPDWEIYYWATGKKVIPERWVNTEVGILDRLRQHVKNEGKTVLRMPDL